MSNIVIMPGETEKNLASLGSGPGLSLIEHRIIVNTKWMNTELGAALEKNKIVMYVGDMSNTDFMILWDETHVAFITQTDLRDCMAYRKKLSALIRNYRAENVKIFVDRSVRSSYYNAFEEYMERGLRHFFTPVESQEELPRLLIQMADEEGKPFDPFVMKAIPSNHREDLIPSPRRHRNVTRQFANPPKKCVIPLSLGSHSDVSTEESR